MGLRLPLVVVVVVVENFRQPKEEKRLEMREAGRGSKSSPITMTTGAEVGTEGGGKLAIIVIVILWSAGGAAAPSGRGH